MFDYRIARKKKVQLISWFDEDEDFPIIIKGDKLAKKVTVSAAGSVQNTPSANAPANIPPPQKAPVPIKKLKKGLLNKGFKSGMVSINSMLHDTGENKKEEEIEDFSDRPRTPFTEKDFKVRWNQYIDKLKKEKRSSLSSTLSSCRPEMGDDFLLNMVFDNKVQQSEFVNHKTDLLGFLRESLQNWGIQIESEVRVNEEVKKYYTNKERFERMMELNPKLAELRKRMNLDTDF